MRFYSSILALTFILIVNFQPTVLADPENTEQAKLLYTLNNQGAPLTDRKSAITRLIQNRNDEAREALVYFLQNQNESRILHQQIAAVADQDSEFLSLLKTKLIDKKTAAYLRQVSLSVLWKKNQDTILPVVLTIAQDPFETFEFRSIAIRYLTPLSKKSEVKDMMTKILKDSEESPQIKKLALNILGKSGDSKVIQNIYQDVALDQSRSINEREDALKKIEAESPSLLEDKLFKILDNKNEKHEMKKMAVQKISENKDRLKSTLPQLKRLERMGPLVNIDDELRRTLRNLIEEIEAEISAEKLNQNDAASGKQAL